MRLNLSYNYATFQAKPLTFDTQNYMFGASMFW